MTPQSSQAFLEAIKALAIDRWGEDRWFKELLSAYVRLENQSLPDDKQLTNNNRRSQLLRVFETGGCRIDTALLLVAAVGHKLQMAKVVTDVEVIDF